MEEISLAGTMPLENPDDEALAHALHRRVPIEECYPAIFNRHPQNLRRAGQTYLSQHPEIGTRVSALDSQLHERSLLDVYATQEWVMGKLYRHAERTCQVTEVVDSEGQPTGEYKPGPFYNDKTHLATVVKIGEQIGMFQKTTHIKTGHIDPVGECKTDEERIALVVAALHELNMPADQLLPAVVDITPTEEEDDGIEYGTAANS